MSKYRIREDVSRDGDSFFFIEIGVLHHVLNDVNIHGEYIYIRKLRWEETGQAYSTKEEALKLSEEWKGKETIETIYKIVICNC